MQSVQYNDCTPDLQPLLTPDVATLLKEGCERHRERGRKKVRRSICDYAPNGVGFRCCRTTLYTSTRT